MNDYVYEEEEFDYDDIACREYFKIPSTMILEKYPKVREEWVSSFIDKSPDNSNDYFKRHWNDIEHPLIRKITNYYLKYIPKSILVEDKRIYEIMAEMEEGYTCIYSKPDR